MSFVYKLVTHKNWDSRVLLNPQKFYGFDNDMLYGYISFCSKEQIPDVLSKKFKLYHSVVILAFDLDKIDKNIKVKRNKEFIRVYGFMDTYDIIGIKTIETSLFDF
jgi:uncharacterized protein (DUF952 family)